MSNLPMVPDNPPVTTRRAPPENKKSLLLSSDENQCIFDILGKGRQTLSTAVTQLLVPTPDQQRWQVKDTGALCLVRDTTKKSYFIQAISLRSKVMVFRQEVYNQFDYRMPQPWFLTFEGDSSMVGINFADRVEAANFKEVLDNKLESKRQRRYERRSRVIENQNFNQNPHSNLGYSAPDRKVPNGTGTTITSTYNFPTKKETKKLSKAKSKDKKKLFRKEDIGNPMNFRHVQHVGWDPTKGFDLAGVDKDFEAFFQKAGVSHNQLEDEGTREFIYNFIETHGGVEAIKQEVTGGRVAPPPPSVSHAGPNYPPPPIPARHSGSSNYPNSNSVPVGKSVAPPPPPSRPMPPVPPPSGYSSSVPPPPVRTVTITHQQNSSPKNLHRIGNGSAPPPPPPPPIGTGIPLPPPLISSYGQGDGESDSGFSNSSIRHTPQVESEDERSALMKQIQKGISLKKIDPEQAKKPSGTLSDCLNQIKTGVDLKRVPETAKQSAPADAMDGLAGALARALAERSRAINPDSSSSDAEEEEQFDEDEWD